MVDRKSLFLGLVLFLGCFTAVQPSAAIHYFLNIPGTQGDVQEPGFEGWIRCASIQYHYRENLHDVYSQGRKSIKHQQKNRQTVSHLQIFYCFLDK